MAAEHYPDTPQLGDVINTWDAPDVDDTMVFHAGTKLEGEHVVTAGISWYGEFHRHDIGWRTIGRERGWHDLLLASPVLH